MTTAAKTLQPHCRNRHVNADILLVGPVHLELSLRDVQVLRVVLSVLNDFGTTRFLHGTGISNTWLRFGVSPKQDLLCRLIKRPATRSC